MYSRSTTIKHTGLCTILKTCLVLSDKCETTNVQNWLVGYWTTTQLYSHWPILNLYILRCGHVFLVLQIFAVFATVAMFPSPCFYGHFEVHYQKRVMESARWYPAQLHYWGQARILTWGTFPLTLPSFLPLRFLSVLICPVIIKGKKAEVNL